MHTLAHRPLTDSRGIVAIETALIVPVLFLLIYGTFEIGRYMLVRAHVHRATASLAEVLVDERSSTKCEFGADGWCLFSDSAVWNALMQTSGDWPRLIDLMVDNDGDPTGIGVNAYWYSIDRDPADTSPALSSFDSQCPDSAVFRDIYGDLLLKAMSTVRNYARPVYLVIQVCYQYRQPSWSTGLYSLVLPEWIESQFVALRKDAVQ